MAYPPHWKVILAGLAVTVLLFSACQRRMDTPTPLGLATPSIKPTQPVGSDLTSAPGTTGKLEPTATPSPPLPSPTPEPLALRVNDLGIPLSQYQAELARRQAAAGHELSADEQQQVVDSLVDQALLAQAAFTQGFTLDEAALQARLDKIIQEAGGESAFQEWLKVNYYELDSFRRDLGLSIAAAWQRDQIAAQVPKVQEQVHARQIRTTTAERAQAVLALLQGGQDFTGLAARYDPVSYGDLGWFPRGYLTDPRLEQAVFELPTGQYTAVIQTDLGYHILQVIERANQRALDPQALLTLQIKAVQEWLSAQRDQAKIEIFLP